MIFPTIKERPRCPCGEFGLIFVDGILLCGKCATKITNKKLMLIRENEVDEND